MIITEAATNPIDIVLTRLEGVKQSGSGWTAKCPAHDGIHQNSLSLHRGEDGRALLKCFAGCTVQEIVNVIGLEMRDLFPQDGRCPMGDGKTNSRSHLTVADLALDKNLPEAFLRELGVVEEGNAIRVTYRLGDGSPAPRQRIRTAFRAKDGSIWTKGTGEIVPYGLWRLEEARSLGYLILVEGESDSWTLWFHGLPTLGIPGADMAGRVRAEYLEGIRKLYIFREPDKGGKTFIAGVARRLQALDWTGEARVIELPNAKDPNDLHKRSPEGFKDAFQAALDGASPLEPPSSPGSESAKVERPGISLEQAFQARQELEKLRAEEAEEAAQPVVDWKEVLAESLANEDPIAALEQMVIPALARLSPIALDDAISKVLKAYRQGGHRGTLKTFKGAVQEAREKFDQARRNRRHQELINLEMVCAYESQNRPPDEETISPENSDIAEKERRSQATHLVELAGEAELFHSPDGEAFATIEATSHRETWPLKAKGFRRWLARQFYEQEEKAPGSQAVQDALAVLEGKALFDGPERPVFTRLAELEGRIYLDLANEPWEAVEITGRGWQVVANPPVKFRRMRGMLPLPRPVSGGKVKELQRFVNVASDDDWALLLSWLMQALCPRGPYPVQVVHGEQGSAKSTTTRVLRALVDPNAAPIRSEPRDGRDLVIAATNGWVVALDNMSHIATWLSDAICRLATGGGFATRELYTDNEEVLFDATRPVIINGIEELATRGDLLDRAIISYLPSIPEDKRKPEKEFWAEFEQARPRILGALLDAVSHALRMLPAVKLDRLPRMADFAKWAMAAEPALGLEVGSFLKAYTNNRRSANDLTLEASPVAGPIRELAEEGFQETASELLEKLNDRVDDSLKRQKSWPSNARALSNMLRRIAPNLRAVGIDVGFGGRESGTGRRLISIKRSENLRNENLRTEAEFCVTTVTPLRKNYEDAGWERF